MVAVLVLPAGYRAVHEALTKAKNGAFHRLDGHLLSRDHARELTVFCPVVFRRCTKEMSDQLRVNNMVFVLR